MYCDEEDLDSRIETIEDIAVKLCEILSCKNCPVVIYNYEKRTEHEKCCLHVHCCENLVKWIKEQK